MTPDEIVRAIQFRASELVVLSDAVGRDMAAALSKNLRLDHPDVAYLQVVRAHLDTAGNELAKALIHAREPQVAATMDDKLADLEGSGDPLAETFEELEGGDPAGEPIADFDRASGTQEGQE